ncbi:SAM-dependent methyltransferase, partial [Streptomyces niveus]
MSVSERYRDSWESYWRETSDAPGEAIWDSHPSLAAVPHCEILLPHADPALPVVDLGCGNGTQTRHLATRFAR